MPISSAASPRKGRTPSTAARPRRGSSPGSATAQLAGLDDARRPRRLPAGQARAALPRLPASTLICVPPPPSSGVAVLQLLAILERTDIAARGPADPQAWFLFAEASRLMYADRDRYVGDPAFVAVPVAGLLDPAYVAGRAPPDRRAAPARRRRRARPPGAASSRADATRSRPAPSHFVDRRRRRQCRLDDDHGRIDLRLGPDGRRLLPQQPDDRLRLPAARRATAARRPTRSRRANGRARR